MRAEPDVLGMVKPDTAVIHRKYPSSNMNIIDHNIDYRCKCSSMIYGKTDVQSIAMKADRSPAMVSLNVYITGDGLTKYLQKQRKWVW